MANLSKKLLQNYRDRFHGDINRSLEQLTAKVDGLEIKIGEAERALHQTQLEINHAQTTLLNDLNKWTKNSGAVSLSDTEILTKIFSGLKMYLDPRDVAITPHIALDGIWEHRITAAWLHLLKPNYTVLDIGSNNGYYGALAAQIMDKKQSQVIMFEANPHLIPYIMKTLAVNFLGDHAVLENLAVSDRAGTLTLNILKDYIGSSSVYSDDRVKSYMPNKWEVETRKSVKVKAVAIDDYCKEHGIKKVDLAIMDIEGFEDKAYAGMRKMVATSPNATLFVEFTKKAYDKPKEFYELMLKDFGNVYVLDDEGYIVSPKHANYEAIVGDAEDWVMPIFSKNAKLAQR